MHISNTLLSTRPSLDLSKTGPPYRSPPHHLPSCFSIVSDRLSPFAYLHTILNQSAISKKFLWSSSSPDHDSPSRKGRMTFIRSSGHEESSLIKPQSNARPMESRLFEIITIHKPVLIWINIQRGRVGTASW